MSSRLTRYPNKPPYGSIYNTSVEAVILVALSTYLIIKTVSNIVSQYCSETDSALWAYLGISDDANGTWRARVTQMVDHSVLLNTHKNVI